MNFSIWPQNISESMFILWPNSTGSFPYISSWKKIYFRFCKIFELTPNREAVWSQLTKTAFGETACGETVYSETNCGEISGHRIIYEFFYVQGSNIFIKCKKIKRCQFEFHLDQIHLQMRQFLIQSRQIGFI